MLLIQIRAQSIDDFPGGNLGKICLEFNSEHPPSDFSVILSQLKRQTTQDNSSNIVKVSKDISSLGPALITVKERNPFIRKHQREKLGKRFRSMEVLSVW